MYYKIYPSSFNLSTYVPLTLLACIHETEITIEDGLFHVITQTDTLAQHTGYDTYIHSLVNPLSIHGYISLIPE